MTGQAVVSTYRSQLAREAELIAARTIPSDWLELVRSEYLEMPGLHLTRKQFQRLWNFDGTTCDALLDTLLRAKFLRCIPDGAYVRIDGGAS